MERNPEVTASTETGIYNVDAQGRLGTGGGTRAAWGPVETQHRWRCVQKPERASQLVGGTPPGHVVQEGFLSACGHVSFSHFAIRILNARWAVLPQPGSDTAPHVMAGGAHCRKEREILQTRRPGRSWEVRGQRLLFFGGKSK